MLIIGLIMSLIIGLFEGFFFKLEPIYENQSRRTAGTWTNCWSRLKTNTDRNLLTQFPVQHNSYCCCLYCFFVFFGLVTVTRILRKIRCLNITFSDQHKTSLSRFVTVLRDQFVRCDLSTVILSFFEA